MNYRTILKGVGGVVALQFFAMSALAQQKTAAYAIIELDVRQPEAFSKEFFPLVATVFANASGTFVVKPSAPTPVDGVEPKRVAIIRFESVEKATATFAPAAYRDVRKVGDQYASFRIFVVEGAAP
jgi:uncharacterized protein (DUF1330 family)